MSIRRPVLLALGWVLAVAVAIGVGVATVSTVGASMRDRGVVGDPSLRDAAVDPSGVPTPAASAAAIVRETITGEYGAFDVGCQGLAAVGLAARAAAGWQVVSYEPGPDDDVDATFRQGTRTADVEVFCNQGRPTLAELEFHELGED